MAKSKVKITSELQRELDLAWLKLEKHELIEAYNPLYTYRVDEEAPHVHVIQQFCSVENFYLTCKHILNIELHTYQLLILQELWLRKFPMLIATRGAGKTFLLAVYAILTALLKQGSKVIVTGAGFRQAKFVFEEAERIYNSAPILRDMCRGYDAKNAGPYKSQDSWVFKIGKSTIHALPTGVDGGKIRGFRSTATICDEFQSMNTDVFESVIAAFGAVNLSPIERIKNSAKNRLLQEKGVIEEGEEYFKNGSGNQTILAGTCTYHFQKFYEYWNRYRTIILSKGDKRKLEEILGEVPDKFDWRDYSVIRFPHILLPEGYLDEKNIARSRATITKDTFAREYECVFTTDSDGFFRRSLIETCVCNDRNPIIKGDETISFAATLTGNPNLEYVFGVDPASEKDNFSIIVLELRQNHRRVVFSWTMTRERFKKLNYPGGVSEKNFYAYCVRKIRELMKVFPTTKIGIDTQGGGIPIEEAFQDTDKMLPNELPIFPAIDRDKPQPTDDKVGLHFLYRINFASADWVANANYGLKKDLEEQQIIFPFYDAISVYNAYEDDLRAGRDFDTYEDCVISIEELKQEMTSIIHSRTPNCNRERWDTPAVKGADGKGRKQRKDRYSALLIANMVARTYQRMDVIDNSYHNVGGFAQGMSTQELESGAKLYHRAPEWFKQGMDYCGVVVIRGGNG